MVILGLSFALFAAHHLVELAVQVAQKLNVSEAVIGTTISGIGTSLPELTIALLSVKKSEGVAIGTLVGSNITDPTLSIGLAALVHPLEVSAAGWTITSGLIIPRNHPFHRRRVALHAHQLPVPSAGRRHADFSVPDLPCAACFATQRPHLGHVSIDEH